MAQGELVSVIGPNGAGKTSLLNCISGFYHPSSGKIIFEGHDLTHASPHQVTKYGIARAFQNIELFTGMSVLENLLMARHTFGRTTCWKTSCSMAGPCGWEWRTAAFVRRS